jgi:hypothetical protein
MPKTGWFPQEQQDKLQMQKSANTILYASQVDNEHTQLMWIWVSFHGHTHLQYFRTPTK